MYGATRKRFAQNQVIFTERLVNLFESCTPFTDSSKITLLRRHDNDSSAMQKKFISSATFSWNFAALSVRYYK